MSSYGTGAYGSGYFGNPGVARSHSKGSLSTEHKNNVDIAAHNGTSGIEPEELIIAAKRKSDVDISGRQSSSTYTSRKETTNIETIP